MSVLRVLVVEDDDAMREVLQQRLEDRGHDVSAAADGAEAERFLDRSSFDVVLSDVVLPDLSGVELLRQVGDSDPDLPVILMTAHGTVDLAVEAMKEGARDFLTKPLDYDRLDELLAALPRRRKRSPDSVEPAARLIGASDRMERTRKALLEAAVTDAAVLIHGESGTGKELAARCIHDASRRADASFVAVNAAAIPSELMESEIFGHEKGAFTGAATRRRGCFELADGGTLFLDEIGEMPLALQPKLLRVLEDGKVRRLGGSEEFEVDARLVAATNRDPVSAIEKGLLREDLYYRLHVFAIEMPPLRDRPEDLDPLIEHFVSDFNQRYGTEVSGVEGAALEKLRQHRWPGNVRELRNVIERGVVLAKSGTIEASHLPLDVREPGARSGETIELTVGTSVAEAERLLILKTLEQTGNNKAEAARQLGVDVKTIRNKLKAYAES